MGRKRLQNRHFTDILKNADVMKLCLSSQLNLTEILKGLSLETALCIGSGQEF